MFDSIEYVDFSVDVLLKEAMGICQTTFGGFTLTEIKELPWLEYQIVIDEIKRIEKESQKGNG